MGTTRYRFATAVTGWWPSRRSGRSRPTRGPALQWQTTELAPGSPAGSVGFATMGPTAAVLGVPHCAVEVGLASFCFRSPPASVRFLASRPGSDLPGLQFGRLDPSVGSGGTASAARLRTG